jgi:hypothetical protein
MMTEKAEREWVPTSFFLAASDDFTTEITFSPRQMLRNTEQRYASEICIYDPVTGKPRHRLRSEPIALGECFRTSSTELRAHLRADTEFYYCEAFNYAVDAPPADVHVALPSNVHYFSRSGRLQGDLGSNYIFGAPRKAFKGDFYYDHFPLGCGVPGTNLRLFLMNPYVRPSSYRILFTSRKRRNHVMAEGEVAGKSVGALEVEIPVTQRAEDGMAVVVAAELKLNAIYGIVHKETGVMCGLDHGHPFLMQRLAH